MSLLDTGGSRADPSTRYRELRKTTAEQFPNELPRSPPHVQVSPHDGENKPSNINIIATQDTPVVCKPSPVKAPTPVSLPPTSLPAQDAITLVGSPLQPDRFAEHQELVSSAAIPNSDEVPSHRTADDVWALCRSGLLDQPHDGRIATTLGASWSAVAEMALHNGWGSKQSIYGSCVPGPLMSKIAGITVANIECLMQNPNFASLSCHGILTVLLQFPSMELSELVCAMADCLEVIATDEYLQPDVHCIKVAQLVSDVEKVAARVPISAAPCSQLHCLWQAIKLVWSTQEILDGDSDSQARRGMARVERQFPWLEESFDVTSLPTPPKVLKRQGLGMPRTPASSHNLLHNGVSSPMCTPDGLTGRDSPESALDLLESSPAGSTSESWSAGHTGGSPTGSVRSVRSGHSEFSWYQDYYPGEDTAAIDEEERVWCEKFEAEYFERLNDMLDYLHDHEAANQESDPLEDTTKECKYGKEYSHMVRVLRATGLLSATQHNCQLQINSAPCSPQSSGSSSVSGSYDSRYNGVMDRHSAGMHAQQPLEWTCSLEVAGNAGAELHEAEAALRACLQVPATLTLVENEDGGSSDLSGTSVLRAVSAAGLGGSSVSGAGAEAPQEPTEAVNVASVQPSTSAVQPSCSWLRKAMKAVQETGRHVGAGTKAACSAVALCVRSVVASAVSGLKGLSSTMWSKLIG